MRRRLRGRQTHHVCRVEFDFRLDIIALSVDRNPGNQRLNYVNGGQAHRLIVKRALEIGDDVTPSFPSAAIIVGRLFCSKSFAKRRFRLSHGCGRQPSVKGEP